MILGSNMIIMLTIFVITVSLHNAIRGDIKSIQDEIRYFHGKLERNDADFKAHLMYYHEQERNRK
jgi:hypothetical protein